MSDIKQSIAYLTGANKSIIHQHLEARLERLRVVIESGLGSVVVKVSGPNKFMLVVINHSRLQVVEGDEIGDLLGFRVLHHICPNDLFLTSLRLVYQPVVNLFAGESLVHVEAEQIPLQKIVDRINVFGLHWPQARRRGSRREMILGDLAGLGGAMGERREANLIQLQPVQGTMVVSTGADGGGEDDTTGVDSLEDAVDIAATSNLLDEDRSQPLRAELLVDAKEVNFGHLDPLSADTDFRRDTADRRNQFTRFGRPDTDVPFLLPARGHQGPVGAERIHGQ